MMYFSRSKTWLVIGVCLPRLPALRAQFCAVTGRLWLPWHKVNLGLDLRGGSYLLMQVDMPAVWSMTGGWTRWPTMRARCC